MKNDKRMCAVCGVKPAASKVGRSTRCEDCRAKARNPVCGRCLERPAVRTRGKRLCEACRLLCAYCDEPRAPNSAYCVEHRSEVARSRPRLLKTCADCGVEFRTKAASNFCNACRHQRMKHPCASCGEPIDKRATHCMKCWGELHRGPDSPNWRGGRTTMKIHGYVLLARPPGHPGGQPYVREHILVMERELGRYLLPGETVHHRNGQRDDNRPENLELWVKSQPAGQRVEDLLAWAREIVARYGN